MGYKKLFVFTALLLLWKVCRVHGQGARVEYFNQPYASPAVATAQCVQPTPQLVVPAIIKSVVQPCESYIQETVPSVPNFNGFSGIGGYNTGIGGYNGGFNGYNGGSNGYPGFFPGFPAPMPPIIIDSDDDDHWHHLLYFLIFAMRNRNNGGCGGNCGGYNNNNNNCGCGGGCNGGCGGYNGYSGGGCGCGGNCGGGCGFNGGYDNSCGCGGCNNGNNCGCGCSYIPYPIPMPLNGAYPYGGFPSYAVYPDNSCGYVDDGYVPAANGNEINLIIRTDSNCCSCS